MLLERLGKELLYFDGGMGTLLQSKGLQQKHYIRHFRLCTMHCKKIQAERGPMDIPTGPHFMFILLFLFLIFLGKKPLHFFVSFRFYLIQFFRCKRSQFFLLEIHI